MSARLVRTIAMLMPIVLMPLVVSPVLAKKGMRDLEQQDLVLVGTCISKGSSLS